MDDEVVDQYCNLTYVSTYDTKYHKWCSIVKNGHQKDSMCDYEIGLCAHNVDTILGSIMDETIPNIN